MRRVILGIDPGFRATGLVAAEVGPDDRPRLVDFAVLRTSKSTKKVTVASDDFACLRHLADELRRWTVGVAAVVIETPAGSKSVRAATGMGYAFAICAAMVEERGLPFELLSADEVKRAVCGKRNASKDEVAAAVSWLPRRLLEERGIPRGKHEHVTDAAALIQAGWETPVVRMVRRMREDAA